MGQPPLPYQQPPAAYPRSWPGRAASGPPAGSPRPQPPPVARRKGGGKTLTIVLSIVAGLVVFWGGGGVLGYLVFFHTSGDPEQLVADYAAAVEHKDCDQIVDQVSKLAWGVLFAASTGERSEAVAGCQDYYADLTPSGMSLESTRLVSKSRTSAVVEATYAATADGGVRVTRTVSYTLRRESREWRIDVFSLPGWL